MKKETDLVELSKCSDSAATRRKMFDYILERRREILRDLWDTAFKEFQLAVFERFKDRLMMNWEPHKADCACALHLFGDSKAYFLKEELAPRFDGPIQCWGIDVVRDAFPSWASLRESEKTALLRDKLTVWSRRWNLDFDWYRNHALATLRHWLEDGEFPFTQLGLQTRERVEQRGWKGATLWG